MRHVHLRIINIKPLKTNRGIRFLELKMEGGAGNFGANPMNHGGGGNWAAPKAMSGGNAPPPFLGKLTKFLKTF